MDAIETPHFDLFGVLGVVNVNVLFLVLISETA